MFVLYLLKSRIESEREREKEKWEVAFMCVWGGVILSRVTRLGDFQKFLMTKFLTKVSHIISNFLGHLEKPNSYVKTAVANSWVTFGKIWATLYSNIWSH